MIFKNMNALAAFTIKAENGEYYPAIISDFFIS